MSFIGPKGLLRSRLRGFQGTVKSVSPILKNRSCQLSRIACCAQLTNPTDTSNLMKARRKSSKEIHILGLGNVGCFVAHSLRSIPSQPSVTLLFHRQGLLENWKRSGETIELRTDGVSDIQGGFDVELAVPLSKEENGAAISSAIDHPPIDHLIVAVKAQNTVAALRSIQHRLTTQSTILFLQNGMGVIDEVDKRLFPSHTDRPHYVIGINSHGLNSTEPFVITHAGNGSINIGTISTGKQDTSSDFLQQTMLQARPLNAVLHSPDKILQLQWEKLVANLVVNPLTTVLDCPNGRLTQPDMANTIRILTTEISAVIQALPEMSSSTKAHFLPDRLQALVIAIATKTAKNYSSMLQDVHAGKETEIAYITGYLLTRAEELGLCCEENENLMRRVLMRRQQVENKKYP
ncbi:hypothetical protein MMC32_002868 [Xylographa parallela]|nr:hypothetical protein [Xylographa parallela]